MGKKKKREEARRLSKLSALRVFEDCTLDELRWIDALGSVVSIPASERLMTEGCAGRDCMILTEGTVEVAHNGRVIGVEGPGAILGEMALLDGCLRSATVTAATRLHAIVLDPREFLALMTVESVRARVLGIAQARSVADGVSLHVRRLLPIAS